MGNSKIDKAFATALFIVALWALIASGHALAVLHSINLAKIF